MSEERIAELEAENQRLKAELEQASNARINLERDLQWAKDDALRLDGACWYCLSPEVEDAWRHDHEGDGRFHWHHRIDPGDGLASDCKHSEMYERIWAEAQEALAEDLQAANLAHEQYREWAAGQMEQMKAKLAEAESILGDNEHLDARIERYFEAK